MIKISQRDRLLASTFIGGALALAIGTGAYAQPNSPAAQGQDVAAPVDTRPDNTQPTDSNDPTSAQDTSVSEVVVTGSRLRQRDLVANSPIETVSVEELTNAGTLTVETFLNTLPQITPSVSTAANNPSANGAALIDLRGLGPGRNLVLLDGRRLVGSDSANTVDVNIIPTALIQRIEIISGGASAVYGADAVSGVVNFILRNDFEGVEADFQAQTSEEGDANQVQAALTIGGNFDEGRGNAVLNFTYANREQLGKGARDFTAQAANTTSFFPSGTYRTNAANLPTQAAVDAVFGRYGVGAGLVQRQGGGTGFGFNGDGTLFATGTAGSGAFQIQNFRRNPGEIATNFAPDFFSYNFEPDNNLILPLERQTFSTFINYDINDNVNVYGQAIMANYRADTALAPSPAPTGTNPTNGLTDFTIPVTNPFIPADLRQILASRTGNNVGIPGVGANEDIVYRFRANALGPRLSSNEVTVYNALAGVRLNLPMDWRGDIYASQGRYQLEEIQDGNLAVRRFESLLDSPTGGTEFCDGGFNPFGVGLNASCADYVRVLAKNRTTIEQDNVVATFNGPIYELPAGAVQFAIGAEYRSVNYNFISDSALQPGEVAGFNGADPLSGTLDFYDLFTEVAIPLLSDQPFAHSLDLTLGARLTDSNLSGSDLSYKAELSYSPIEEVRFRAAYQRAIRSPGVGELFQVPTENNPEINDPCNFNGRTAAALAICTQQALALGFSPAQATDLLDDFVPGNSQIQSLTGGNPNLDPETANTYTAGVVFRPSWDNPYFQNISFSIDYFNIRINDVINASDEQLIANNCYASGSATSVECQAFRRSVVDFGIIDLQALNSNQGFIETSGVDFSVGGRIPLDDISGMNWLGTLNIGLVLTYMHEFRQQDVEDGPVFDYAGTIGSAYGQTLPEYKANVNLGWSSGAFGLDLRGQYIDEMEHRNDVIAEGGDDASATGVDSAWYWDLSGRYALNDTVEFRAGVLNLFDRDIEEYDPFIDAQTDPSTYDVIGRRYYAGINLRF